VSRWARISVELSHTWPGEAYLRFEAADGTATMVAVDRDDLVAVGRLDGALGQSAVQDVSEPISGGIGSVFSRARSDVTAAVNAYSRGRIFHADGNRCPHGLDLSRRVLDDGFEPGHTPLGEVLLPLPLLCRDGKTLTQIEFDNDEPFIAQPMDVQQ
jgi:hypothetical protein